MLQKSKLIAIDSRGCILLVRNRKSKQYNFPGGRAIRGESSILTLRREIRQELPKIHLRRTRRWRNEPRFKRKNSVFYFSVVKGPLKTGAEIDRAVRARRWKQMKTSRSTRATLKILTVRGYL